MNSNFTYRSDIDGLRAVAVLLVIFFHAGFPFVGGGYIGVDVFFVLSGFLITLTIDKEMSEQNFSFTQFYLRRIRRIIPVLVFIILVTTIPAYLFLFADNFESYGRTLIQTMLSTNNFYLWINQGQYFAENADLIPFLHTWSLSVEEQFYFLWPISLFFLHRKFSTKNRLVFVFIFLILTTILSVYLTNTNPNLAYFLLPARIFELAIGACLAMFWYTIPELTKNTNHLLSIIGLFLVLVPTYFLNKASIFPGLNAFWPCLGTAILIITGKNDDSKGIINKLLQNKILVLCGLLSYSMYLWHWPLFTFIKYLGISLDGVVRMVSLLAIFILSYFSWKFIEQPFRINYKYNFKKTFLFGFLPSILIIAGIYGVLDAKDGFPERFPKLSEFNPKINFANKVRSDCYYSYKVGNCETCFLGIKKDTLDGLLIGDSFANHAVSFLDVLAKDAGLYIHDSTAPANPLLNTLNDDGTDFFPPEYAKRRLEYAKKFKTIYIAANWELVTNPLSKNHQSIVNTVGNLIKLNKKVVIIESLRTVSEINLHKAKLYKAGNAVYFSETDFSIPFVPRPANYILNEIKQKYPTVQIIDLNDVMCHDGKCDIAINEEIVYKDVSHLNISGAKLLGEKYLKLKGNPLKK